MALGLLVLRRNRGNFGRLSTLIARNLRHSAQIVKSNDAFPFKVNPLRQFHTTSAALVPEKKKIDLSGIFPPIVTPFQDDEKISYSKLKENFSKWNDVPFRGMINVEFINIVQSLLFCP